MRGILFPNSNIIFDAQNEDPATEEEGRRGQYGNVVRRMAERRERRARAGRVGQPADDSGTHVQQRQARAARTAPTGRSSCRASRRRSRPPTRPPSRRTWTTSSTRPAPLTEACTACHDVYREKPNLSLIGARRNDYKRVSSSAMEALPSSTALRESLNGYPITVDVACRQHVPVPRADHHDGSPSGGLRVPADAVFRAPAAAVSVADVRPGDHVRSAAVLLFYGQPMRYYGKALFWIKMVLMVLAGVNALVLSLTTYRSVAQVGSGHDLCRSAPSSPASCRWSCGRASSCSGGSPRITGSRTSSNGVHDCFPLFQWIENSRAHRDPALQWRGSAR